MTRPEAPLLVRAATEADAEAIAAIEQAAAHRPWSEDDVRRTLEAATTAAWVIGPPGEVLGHLLSRWVAEEAEILTLAVHPAAQQRGYGRALVGAAAAYWRSIGITAAWLEVRTDNDAALRLYAATGWVDAGIRRRYYPDGADARVMRWSG